MRMRCSASTAIAWRRHPEWPRLTVVQNPREAKPIEAAVANIDHRVDYIDDAELRRLQNANWYHLCLSETEGFGHYLVEAMSVAAIAITTDAAPMNELIQPDRGVLVGYSATGIQHLATTYFFDEDVLETEIQRLLAAPDEELRQIGDQAREWFLANDRGFSRRLQLALTPLLS